MKRCIVCWAVNAPDCPAPRLANCLFAGITWLFAYIVLLLWYLFR